MRKLNHILIIFLVLIAANPVLAQSKFRDALNFEDSQFVNMGNLEILHRYQKFSGTETDSDGIDFDRTVLTYQFTYGVMTNFEVGIGVPIVFTKDGDQDELGDMNIFQRFKFTEEGESEFDFSGGFELLLPTGDDDHPAVGSDDLDARFHLTASRSFGDGWKWLAHLGYRFYGEDANDDHFEYNFAMNSLLTPDFKAILEFNGRSGGVPDQSELYISPGFVFKPRDGFTTTVSIPLGISGDAANHLANFQFIVEF